MLTLTIQQFSCFLHFQPRYNPYGNSIVYVFVDNQWHNWQPVVFSIFDICPSILAYILSSLKCHIKHIRVWYHVESFCSIASILICKIICLIFRSNQRELFQLCQSQTNKPHRTAKDSGWHCTPYKQTSRKRWPIENQDLKWGNDLYQEWTGLSCLEYLGTQPFKFCKLNS